MRSERGVKLFFPGERCQAGRKPLPPPLKPAPRLARATRKKSLAPRPLARVQATPKPGGLAKKQSAIPPPCKFVFWPGLRVLRRGGMRAGGERSKNRAKCGPVPDTGRPHAQAKAAAAGRTHPPRAGPDARARPARQAATASTRQAQGQAAKPRAAA